MDFSEKTMKSDKFYEGKVLNLRIDTVELPDKKYSKREIIEHPGSAAVFGITKDGKVILVKQYRKAVEKFLLELPAGKVEVNEEPRETAYREFLEETGYKIGNLVFLTEIFTSPGFTNESVHIFFADDLEKTDDLSHEDEFIEVIEMTLDELASKIDAGKIRDSKTIIGFFAYKYMFEDLDVDK